jgi:hypothetical protein
VELLTLQRQILSPPVLLSGRHGKGESTHPHLEIHLTNMSPKIRQCHQQIPEDVELEPMSAMEGPNLASSLKIPFTYCW